MWRGYLFNRFLLSSEHMCSNTSLENMWVGEFGLGSLPDGTLHSPHHKTISRGLTELPAPPSLYQRPRNVHMITPFPQTSFLLSFASRKHVGKRVWPEWRKKKNPKEMRGKNKASKGERGRDETWGCLGRVQYCCIKVGTPKGHRYLCSWPQGTQTQLVLPHFPTAALHFCCRVAARHPPGPLLLLLQHRSMLTDCPAP